MAFSGYSQNEPVYKEILFLNITSVTVGGVSSEIDTLSIPVMPDVNGMLFFLEITEESGSSPTLDVSIQAVIDGTAFQLGAFDTKNIPGKSVLYLTGVPRTLRVDYAVGGPDTVVSFKVTAVRC